MDEALAWRVETACLNACPAARQMIVDGWLLRADGGAVRRVNSVNALPASPAADRAASIAATVARCEHAYRAIEQPALFRVTELVPGLDPLLAERGYTREGETLTLYARCDPPPLPMDTRVDAVADADWRAAQAAFSGADPGTVARFEAMLALIVPPAGFATVRAEGRVAAIGYGVLSDGLLVLEAIATDPALRGRGHGRAAVAGLLRWAAGHGVDAVCLQVTQDNHAARALYAGFGVDATLYRYHYRRAPL